MADDVMDALRVSINSHDPQRVADCFTADYACERPLRPHEAFVGNENVLKNWTAILGRFPDLHAEILRRARDGEELWSEWEMRATGPDGTPALLRGPVIATAREGRIAWARFYLDPVTHAGATSTTVSAVVDAPADRIFGLLTDPTRHRDLDASNTVRAALTREPIAAVGDVFTMAMHSALFGAYTTENHVVLLDPDRAVGWAPGERPRGHRYIWRLHALDADRTEVTQTYDWSAVTHAPAVPHLPARSAGELAGSIRLIGEALR